MRFAQTGAMLLWRYFSLVGLVIWAVGCNSAETPVAADAGSADAAQGGNGGGTGGTGGQTGGSGGTATGGTTGTGGAGGPGNSLDAGVCSGAVCAIYCPYGNVLDGRGCPTCGCKPPPADGAAPCDQGDCALAATLGDMACGTSVDVKLGTRVTVSLASTYWTIQGSSRPAVLAQVGVMTYGKGVNCPPFPGTGCGTANLTFEAVGLGQAVISAGRTTCGEALACQPGEGRDRCTITVNVGP
jgi:hypothetical protein